MPTEGQKTKASAISSEYEAGSCRVTHSVGPGRANTVVACPDGRTVVIPPFGIPRDNRSEADHA